jgi:hypothetical protein
MLPETINRTPFATEALFIADEEGVPVLVPIVKGTYEIGTGGRLNLADQQIPVNSTGERWTPTESSSYKYEPETALIKPGTDVVLIGSAYSAHSRVAEVDVTLRVGPLEKSVHVTGDRTWVKRIGGGISATSPQPFERMPLVYERAFGGWDRSSPDSASHSFEPRNPVGVGFRTSRRTFQDGLSLPNIEDARIRIGGIGDTPPPAGLGFVSPDWQPRAALAGTYDQAWMKTRMPLLPVDFDRRFFNAASSGLTSASHLRGDEPVLARNVIPSGELAFRLPGVPAPLCSIRFARAAERRVETQLDTVIINSDEGRLLLLWRGVAPVRAYPHEIRTISIDAEGVPIHTQ